MLLITESSFRKIHHDIDFMYLCAYMYQLEVLWLQRDDYVGRPTTLVYQIRIPVWLFIFWKNVSLYGLIWCCIFINFWEKVENWSYLLKIYYIKAKNFTLYALIRCCIFIKNSILVNLYDYLRGYAYLIE